MREANFYILVEGRNDARIVESMIRDMSGYSIIVADGFSSLLSKAATILKTKSSPLVLFADTDSVESTEVRSKDLFIKDILNYRSYESRLQVILSSPEIEVTLFSNVEFFKKYFETEISVFEWEQMKQAPKQSLQILIGSRDIYDVILADQKWLVELRKSPQRKKIEKFYEKYIS